MRIGLICDIHEDFRSLREALRQLEKLNCDELICLGDIVGYDTSCDQPGIVRKPSACIDAVRSNCRYVLAGNHDLYAIRKLPQSTPAFEYPPDWYQLSPDQRRARSRGNVWLFESESAATHLKRPAKRYLDSLPEQLVGSYDGLAMHFSHSVHPDLTGTLMLRPDNPWELRVHLRTLKQKGCTYGLSGHMHPHGLMIGRERGIRSASFGRLALATGVAQYFCPAITRDSVGRGYTILDCAARTIETVQYGIDGNKRRSLYERLLKAP